MNILLIKQTSLGDVLHSTGHIRAVKEAYPNSHITVLTSTTCEGILAHHPAINRLITVDRAKVKKDALRQPIWAWKHMTGVVKQVNQRDYDLAIDLQGLLKSVLFLYLAKAKLKVVKGRWWGIKGFRNKQLHAIDEMTAVLRLAGIEASDVSMMFHTTKSAKATATKRLEKLKPQQNELVIISPFTRWASKNWPLANSVELANKLSDSATVLLSGTADDRAAIDIEIKRQQTNGVHNIAGQLDLADFTEVVRQAQLLITGDSFPMHLAGAVNTPVIALFGPTDESKTGPRGTHSKVLRAPDCLMCDRSSCENKCLQQITVEQVLQTANKMRSGH